ncbi:MAG: hypothetical protein AB2551_02050 [Candidatus Thiodiazotropha sp.]
MVPEAGQWRYFSIMCITIPSSANVARSRSLPLWNWLAESPLRLLSAAGLLSLLFALVQWRFYPPASLQWPLLNLLFAITPTLFLGFSLSYMPIWLKVTPLSYVGYGLLFVLILIVQLVFHLSMLFGETAGLLYMILLGISWLVSLKVLRGFIQRSFQRRHFLQWGIFAALLWGCLLGALFALTALFGVQLSQSLYWLGGLSYLLPLTAFLIISSVSY